MILLFDTKPRTDEGFHAAAIFGVGLIGAAIVRALESRGYDASRCLPLNWINAEQRRLDLARLGSTIEEFGGVAGGRGRIDVVWAAGPAGFSARKEVLDAETCAFRDVADWSRAFRHSDVCKRIVFHMMSSGGGIFEGQRFIEATSVARPVRAYGVAKLEQEGIVEDLRRDLVGHVYRPSSVYGFSGRLGVVNTLINNSLLRRVSNIYGSLHTLRDYVFSSDIGRFVADRTDDGETGSQTFTLASGKATSMSEMLNIIRAVVGRPLYLKIESRPFNAEDITYRRSALPEGWRTTDLETGIRIVSQRLAKTRESGR